MNSRYMTLFALLIFSVCAVMGQNAMAQTRLGLHVTQEELDIWRQRAVSGPYKSAWDNHILPKANSFRSNPTDGTWKGWTGPGCFPQDQDTGLGGHNYDGLGTSKGEGLLKSAFVYLITGDTSYRDPVRNLLLSQAANPGTDFSNSSLWCVRWSQSTLWVANWLTKLLFAYDYIRPSLSTSDRSKLDTWFHNAAIYWEAVVSNEITTQKFPNRPDYSTCSGWGCPGKFKGKSHWNGWDVSGFNLGAWMNQPAAAMLFAGSVAILVNDVTLQNKAKMWVKEEVMFSMYPDGTIADQYRWNDTNPPSISSAWSHGALQLIPVLMIADHFARAGDLELYEFTTTQGMFGTNGGPKSLLKGMQRLAKMANGTIKVYASYDSTLTSDKILTWNTGNGHIEDLAMAQSNIFYRDPEVKTAVSRTPPSNPSCGGYNCWGDPWGGVPDTLFMFGQMEGKVWPYPSGNPTALNPPTSLRVMGQ